MRRFLLALSLLIQWMALNGQESFEEDFSPVTLHCLGEQRSSPTSIWLAFELHVEEGWHIYWKNPGDIGLATALELLLSDGVEIQEERWSSPSYFKEDDHQFFGYTSRVPFLLELAHRRDAQSLTIEGRVDFLACSEEGCHPGSVLLPRRVIDIVGGEEVDLTPLIAAMPKRERITALIEGNDLLINVSPHLQGKESLLFVSDHPEGGFARLIAMEEPHLYRLQGDQFSWKEGDLLQGVIIAEVAGKVQEGVELSLLLGEGERIASQEVDEESFSLGWMVLFATLGGLLLNLMPCVLPVLSFKILALIEMAGGSREAALRQGLFFTAGVVVSFWSLAAILLSFRASGEFLGWGFQLQDPTFVAFLALLLIAISMNYFGLFEMGSQLASWASQGEHQIHKKGGSASSFFSGVLATFVATPCTGPFLGTAMGAALALPVVSSLLLFTAVALGMSAPYLLFSLYPALLRFLPRAGQWMGHFRVVLGFMLLATVLWLFWVLSYQAGSEGVMILLASALLLSFALWLYGSFQHAVRGRGLRQGGMVLALVLAIVAIAAPLKSIASLATTAFVNDREQNEESSGWNSFQQEHFEAALASNQPLFVDFTAKWCLICQANHMVLETSDVQRAFQERGVVKFKADWTHRDRYISEQLRKWKRSSVPLYLLFPGGNRPPVVLPQLLTSDILLEELQKLGEG